MWPEAQRFVALEAGWEASEAPPAQGTVTKALRMGVAGRGMQHGGGLQLGNGALPSRQPCRPQVSANGNVLRSEIVGSIKMRVFLSGMPELRLGLNDKVLFDNTGRESPCGQTKPRCPRPRVPSSEQSRADIHLHEKQLISSTCS